MSDLPKIHLIVQEPDHWSQAMNQVFRTWTSNNNWSDKNSAQFQNESGVTSLMIYWLHHRFRKSLISGCGRGFFMEPIGIWNWRNFFIVLRKSFWGTLFSSFFRVSTLPAQEEPWVVTGADISVYAAQSTTIVNNLLAMLKQTKPPTARTEWRKNTNKWTTTVKQRVKKS